MIKTLFFFLLSQILLESHGHWYENTQVLELTTENFYDYIGKSSHVIVDFYAPWCFYCQAMFQQYEELRKMYNGENPKRRDVIIAKINGNAHQSITQNYEIYSYPAIVHFAPNSRDISSVFQQHRTKEHMSYWIENISGPEEKKIEEKIEVKIQVKAEEKKEEKKDEEKKNEEKKEEEKKNDEKKEEEKNEEEKNDEKKEEEKKDENIILEVEMLDNIDEKKMLDILTAMGDQLKFLDKIQTVSSKRLLEKLNDQLDILKAHIFSLNSEISHTKSNGLNLKHVSVFFMLGMLIGLALAFTLMRFSKLNSQVFPIKTV